MIEKSDNSKEPFAGYYLVAFFDLLGQQAELRQMHTLPNPADPTEVNEFTNRIKQTYGAVKGMRTSFRGFFNSYMKSYADTYPLDPAQRHIFDQCKSNDIKIQQFSDCIAIFMPLRDDINKLPMKGVFGVLAASATTFLSCMAYGQPIRGGIDIGLALEIDDDEVYGPALSRAYNLESTVAQYPRVVIGEELIKYLNLHCNQEEKDIFTTISKASAKACLKLLATDDDGNPFIDYLGEYFKESMDETYNLEIITKAYQHVISESEKHKKQKNPKVAFKYTLLRNYFDVRMPIWQNP
jgi:hypothetical protein